LVVFVEDSATTSWRKITARSSRLFFSGLLAVRGSPKKREPQ